MSVADASLITDALAGAGSRGDAAIERVGTTQVWHAPHALPAEVMSAIRGLRRGQHISATVASAAQDRLRRMRFVLHAFAPFHDRVWELRDNATPYDAWYVALAESLDAALVTADAKLSQMPGIQCEVELISPGV